MNRYLCLFAHQSTLRAPLAVCWHLRRSSRLASLLSSRRQRTTSIPAVPRPSRRKASTLYWLSAGIFGYIVVTYATSTYLRAAASSAAPSDPALQADVSARYDETATTFDASIDWYEWAGGIAALRRKLAGEARGHVLEVSAGTGRNAEYLDLPRCKSVTMLDQSAAMIEVAQRKFSAAHPTYQAARFRVQSALEPIVAPPGGYDTIIQTMGLCSTKDPVRLLAQLGILARANSGRILLLEHGRSYFDWVNELLDRSAMAHAQKHGCWWNRDIGGLVAESGLEVVKVKRYHLGTTWWMELRPKER